LTDARRLLALVVRNGAIQVLLFSDPCDEVLQNWADAKGIAADQRIMVLESDLLSALARFEAASSALQGVLGDAFAEGGRASGVEEISLTRIDETVSPVIRLINSTLFDAMGAGASDIHLEAAASGLVVKYRIDGVIGNRPCAWRTAQ
jgi:general secretion pathway protein E